MHEPKENKKTFADERSTGQYFAGYRRIGGATIARAATDPVGP